MTGSRESALRVDTSPGAAGCTLVTVDGNLDVDSAATLRDALEGLLARSVIEIVVDLSGLEFCDSIGLTALVDTHRACAARDGYFRLAAPTPFLTRVLAVVGLLGQLAVYDSVEAACADRPRGGR